MVLSASETLRNTFRHKDLDQEQANEHKLCIRLFPEQSSNWQPKQESILQSVIKKLFPKQYKNKLRILRHLISKSSTTNLFFQSKKAIATELDCCLSTVRNILKEFEERKLIYIFESERKDKPGKQGANIIVLNWEKIGYFPGRMFKKVTNDLFTKIRFKNDRDLEKVNEYITRLNKIREQKVLDKRPNNEQIERGGVQHYTPGSKTTYSELKTCMYILKNNIKDLDDRLAVLAEIITNTIESKTKQISNLERWRERVATEYYNALVSIRDQGVSRLTIERYIERLVNDETTKWVWGNAATLNDRFFQYLKQQESKPTKPTRTTKDPLLLPPELKAYQATLIRWVHYLEEKTGTATPYSQLERIIDRMLRLTPSDFRLSVDSAISGGYRNFLDKLYKRRINGRPETDFEETQRLIREKDDEKFEIAVDSKTSLQLEEQRLDKVQDKLIKLIEKLQADEQLVEEIMKIAENSGLDKALEKAEHLIKIMKL